MDGLRLYGAAVDGITQVLKWRKQFLLEFQAPMQIRKARATFNTLPPMVKEAMQKADPKQYAELVERLQRETS